MEFENNNFASVLILKNIYFEKIYFERTATIPDKFVTKFIPKYAEKKNNEIEVKLICQIQSDTNFNMEIILVGVFENTEKDEKLRAEINKYNTLTILFPYLRSELSLVSAQPNFPTIDLPIVNINALVDNDGELTAKLGQGK